MSYVLDTNHVIAFIKKRQPQVRDAVAARSRGGSRIIVPSIVMFELWYGVAKSDFRAENAARLSVLTRTPFEFASFDEADGQTAGEIRDALEAKGTPIGPYDYLIAAQALRRGAVLVSANTREFSRVDGLALENWI